jgi:NAD(P)-dependent dehydrogenase (short-subunit alcohol dehydrogenase family)
MGDAWQFAPGPTDLAGRTVLITGATGALGSAVSLACARYGATVVLCGRNVPELEKLYDRIEQSGAPQPAIMPVDLEGASDADYRIVAEALADGLTALDGLLHIAGALGQLSPIEHADTRQWQRALSVNLSAPFYLTQACMPLLKRSPDASIVFTLDDKTRAYWAGYGVAKAGLAALAKILADEWDPPPGETRNLRINAVDPGPLRSRLRRAAYPAENAQLPADPGERVAPYLYLLSEASRDVNGMQFSHAQAVRAL